MCTLWSTKSHSNSFVNMSTTGISALISTTTFFFKCKHICWFTLAIDRVRFICTYPQKETWERNRNTQNYLVLESMSLIGIHKSSTLSEKKNLEQLVSEAVNLAFPYLILYRTFTEPYKTFVQRTSLFLSLFFSLSLLLLSLSLSLRVFIAKACLGQ